MSVPDASRTGTITTATPGAGNSLALDVHVMAVATVQVEGTFTGTLQIEGSIDGATMHPIAAIPAAGGTSVTSITAPGIWEVNVGAYAMVQVRASAFASGTATVTLLASLQGTVGSGTSAGGGGAVTVADGADIAQGATADAIVAAGATGSLSAKLRRVTQGLEDLKSLIVLAAGESHLGNVGGLTVYSTISYTRPADTAVYAAGDSVANSTSAPAALIFPACARINAGSGLIVGATMLDQTAQATKGSFELWVFASTAAPTATNDNAAFALSVANAGNLVGVFPFTTPYVGNTSTSSTGNTFYRSDVTNVPFKCGAGVVTLWGLVVVRNAYTPISGEVLAFTLQIAQD